MLENLVLGQGQPSTTLGTILFVLVSFILLIALVKKFAWTSLVDMMKKREDQIANDLDSAEKARLTAQKLEQQRQEALQNSRNEAITILNQAKENGEENRQKMMQEAKTTIEHLKAKTNEQLIRDKEETMLEMKQDISRLSLDLAAKLLNQELSEEKHHALIHDFIEEIGTSHETR